MAWYFFSMTGKSKWVRHLAEMRETVMQAEPEFVTVLDVNHPCDEDTLPEKLFYRGPMYFDWDGKAELDDLLDDVRRFMLKLEDWGFDLNQASWYLSGKKGIHCTIPMGCLFDKKFCQAGIPDLFRLYGRFAWENATTYMDMRVYSGRKGRMWRTTCRPRNVDGKTTYKVAIKPEQLKTLTAEGYWQWCSEKRPLIEAEPPTLNMQMATELQVQLGKMLADLNSKVKRKANPDIFKAWQDEKPPTLEAAFTGQNVNMERDLNDIGLQFATAAIALGLDSYDHTNQFLEWCAGFIEARSQILGTAHRTSAAIRERLTQSFHYCLGNPSYVYIPETFAKILQPEQASNLDLKGIKEGVSNEKIQVISKGLQAGTLVDDCAVYAESKDEIKVLADYSWKQGSVYSVRDQQNHITHYSVVPIVKGEEQPRQLVSLNQLLNNKDFAKMLAQHGGTSLVASTPQQSAIKRSLLTFAGDDNVQDLKVTRLEGLHFETTADPEDGVYEGAMYWVQPQETVVSIRHQSQQSAPTFLDNNNPNGQYNSDLSQAYDFSQYLSHNREMVGHLLELNGDYYSLSLMLAWFTACVIKHPLYKLKRIKNFPILQIVGQAGCGKTTTANLLLHLFTWRNPFKINIAGRNLTPFALSSLAVSSTSLPLVIDEVKPQNLGPHYMADFRGFIQTIYTLGSEAKRGGGDGQNGSYQTITRDQMFSPVCFLAESLEATQASILERSVVAAFHKDAVHGRMKHQQFLSRNERNIGMLGWALVQQMMNYDLSQLVKLHDKAVNEATELLQEVNNHRVVENAAMMLAGFDFFSELIEKFFPNQFSNKLTALRSNLAKEDRWLTQVSSEVSRFINLLAAASYDDDPTAIIKGKHYFFTDGETDSGRVQMVVINLHNCFAIYRVRMRHMGLHPAFSSTEELKFSLIHSKAFVELVIDPSRNGTGVKLNCDILTKEGVTSFKA